MILDHLRTATRSHPIPRTELAQRVGLSPRELEAAIQALVLAGEAIGSSTGKPSGYFLLTTEEDRQRAMRQLESRIIHLSKRLAALKRCSVGDSLVQLGLSYQEDSHV